MKKIIIGLLTIVIFLFAYWFYQKNNNLSIEEAFGPIENQEFNELLTLEQGYDIISPYVKKWGDDAVLTKYSTTVVTDKYNFKVNFYSFLSLKNKEWIIISYNYPLNTNVIDAYGSVNFDKISNYRPTKKFNIIKIPWTGDDLLLKEAVKDYQWPMDKIISSEEIINTANANGLNDFLTKYKNLDLYANGLNLIKNKDNYEWQIGLSYDYGDDKVIRFLNIYDAISAKLIYTAGVDGKVENKWLQ